MSSGATPANSPAALRRSLRRGAPRSQTQPVLRNRTLLKRVVHAAVVSPRLLVALIGLATAATLAPLITTLYLRRIVNGLIAHDSFGTLASSLAVIAGALLVGVAATLAAGRLSGILGYRIIEDLQRRVFDRLAAMPLAFFTTVSSGSIVSRITSDTAVIEPLFTTVLVTAISNSIGVVFVVIVLFVVDWRLALVLIVVPGLLLPLRFAESQINALIRDSFDKVRDLSNTVSSYLTRDGVLLARQSGRVDDEASTFYRLTDELRRISIRNLFWRTAGGATFDAAFALAGVGVIGVGAYLAAHHELSVGTVVLFALYVRQLQAPFSGVVGLRYPAIRAGIAFTRVYDVLESSVPADQRAASVRHTGSTIFGSAIPGSAPVLRFENVTYAYPATDEVSIPGLSHTSGPVGIGWMPLVSLQREDNPTTAPARRTILTDVSFGLEPGRMLAIVGESGAGKSTIAQLAIGLLLPDGGRVLLDGTDTTSLSYLDLADAIGYIAQDTHVLHDTVRSNLLYAHASASDADLADALRVARFDRVLDHLPEGLDTVIGEKGYRLSGGERQRLSIARAVLRRPRLVVLDEPTSQLDAATEYEIKGALAEAFSDTAVLTIAHRLSTVIDADRILVLDSGHIVESGTHRELLTHGGRYSALYRTQLEVPPA